MIKRLLFLLVLFPVALFSQNTYLINNIVEPGPYSVGQIITVKFKIQYEATPTNLVQFDYKYNNKLLEKVDHTFQIQGYQTSLNHWDGYFFNHKPGTDPTHLKVQLDAWNTAGGASYVNNPDWSVERITIQGAAYIPSPTDMISVRFRVKDKGVTSYTNYSNILSNSWAMYRDMATNQNSGVFGTPALSLDAVSGGDAGAVVLNLNTTTTHPTHYKYRIEHTGTQQTIASGYFDSNSQATITGLKVGTTYHTEIKIDDVLAKDWLDEVVTISDAYLTFKQAIGAGSDPNSTGANIFSHPIQYLYGEVTNDGKVTFDDSYAMLNHLLGQPTSTWYTSVANNGKNFWGRVENYGVATNDYYYGQNYYFTPSDTQKQFTYSHGFIGDVDFSHSAIPTAQGGSFSKLSTTSKTAANAELYTLEVATTLVNGKVVLETKLDLQKLAGIQFIVQYDPSMLSFDEVKFDTGNQMTNFATPKDNKIYFGSMDSSGAQTIKTGTPYKLVFTPKTALTNTAGLIYFKVAEAVKQDGTKVILKIQ